MKFTFDKNAMVKEIGMAQEIISNKSAYSILSNVMLIAENSSLTIKATDTRMNFESKIPVNIEEEGTTTVFCDKFMAILSSMPEGDVDFVVEQKDNRTIAVIRHSTKKIKFQLICIPQDRFPEFASAENVPFFDIPSKEIKKMITQTSFAVSTDEAKFFLNGVYFGKNGDKLVFVATDGRRLAYADNEVLQGISDFPPAIVHPKILNIIAKHLSDEGSISVAVVDKMIFFNFANYKLSSALIDGQFPNFQRVIPENQQFNFQVEKSDLMGALRRTSIIVDKKAGRVFFNLKPGVLTITSAESDFGDTKEEIPCQYNGDEVTLAVNYHHVEDPLKVIESDRVKFEFTELTKAVTLKPEPEENYFHIIQPMNI